MRALSMIPLVAVGLLAGCATASPDRLAPQSQARLATVKTAALLPPDVKVYELAAGGTLELMDEWSQKARQNVVASLEKRLGQGDPLELKAFDPAQDPALDEELRDVRALYEAVAASVIAHTYAPATTFETKKERFDYSLGPLPKLAEAAGADTVLFVYASDQVSSGGRVAVNVLTTVIGAAAGVVIVPRGGVTVITAALVDTKSGDVLWFTAHGSRGGRDLTDPRKAEDLVKDAFERLRKDTGAAASASSPR